MALTPSQITNPSVKSAKSQKKSEKVGGFARPEVSGPMSVEVMELSEIYNIRAQALKKVRMYP
eukprot:549351-Amorphochlora_amoeboformis.AAC.1